MPDSIRLARLKRRLDQLESTRPAETSLFALGHAGLDARLRGGLAMGALHEICAAKAGEPWAASGCALMLALRVGQSKGQSTDMGKGKDRPIVWVRDDKAARLYGGLYGPGLAELGASADQIILVQAPDTVSVLRAGADITGAIGPSAVVIEPFGAARALDLTASRKLVLAAERAGSTAFILRDGASGFASAASTRWSVEAAPSQPLAGDAPGHTALRLALLRHRGGIAPFEICVEWNRDDQAFGEPASLSGALPALAERGQMAA